MSTLNESHDSQNPTHPPRAKNKLLSRPSSLLNPRVFAVIVAVLLVGIVVVKFTLASSTQAGLTAQYFNNQTLSGTPVVTRVDPQVNYNWGTTSPAPGVPSTNFSVRWTGNLTPSQSGVYQIFTASDDGVRVWINNQLVVNSWTNHGSMENSGSIKLTSGTSYPVKVEYYQNQGQALVSLQWASNPLGIARTVIPQSLLSTAVSTSPSPSPSATPTTSATPVPTPTSTPAPTPTTTTWNCTRSECDYPADPTHFVGMNVNKWKDPLGNNISTNVWSPVSGESVKLSANSAQNYRITASANNPSGSVTAYPNASPAHGAGLGSDYTGIVDDYTSLTETVSETMPINSKTSAWAMDDDWFSDPGHPEDNYDYELMIQYDFSNNGDCNATANNININGTLWHVCLDQGSRPNGVCNDCGYIAWKLGATEADKPSVPTMSMTIDIKAIVTWLETHKVPGQTYNYMNPGVSVSALSNGWEIANTSGTTENFDGNGYTVKATGGCAAGITADCNLK